MTRLLAILDRMDRNPDDEEDDPGEDIGDYEPYLAGSCDDREDGDDNGIADSGGMLSWYGN